jgi:hypothetical protein
MAHGQTVPTPTKSDLGASPPTEEQRPVKVGSHTATLITQTTHLTAPGASTATLVTRILQWQPVAGVTVEVSSGLDQTELLAVASKLRFDTASRCSVPLRLTALPSGAQLTACEVYFLGSQPGQPALGPQSGLTIGRGAVDAIRLSVKTGRPLPAASFSASPTTLPNGWPAGIVGYDGGAAMQIFDAGGFGVEIAASGGYGATDVATVGEGLRKSGDIAKPATWPADPLK